MKRYHLKGNYDFKPNKNKTNYENLYNNLVVEYYDLKDNYEETQKDYIESIKSKNEMCEKNDSLEHTVRLLKYWFPLAIYMFCCINVIWNYNDNYLDSLHALVTNIILFVITLLITGGIVGFLIDSLETTKSKWLFWIGSLILIPLFVLLLASNPEERSQITEPTPTIEESYQQGYDEGYEAAEKHFADEIEIAENVRYYGDLRELYREIAGDIESPYENTYK